VTLARRPAPCGDYCNNSASASAFPHAITLSSACCTLSGSRVPKTSRAGRRSGTADVIRHYAAEPEDAIELGRASRHYEPECARDLAFESATELEFIKLRETQIEHDEIDPF